MIPYEIYDQIQIGFLTIYTWGLFLSLSFLIGLFLFLWQAKKKNQNLVKMFYLVIFVIIMSFIGAKIGFLLQWPDKLFNISNYLNSQGYMFYGGLIGAFLGGLIYTKLAKLDFWTLSDMATLPIILGVFLTRLGCFCIKDHPGAVTNMPWGILWPDGLIRHPAALYLCLNGLVMFFLWLFFKNKLKTKGQFFISFLIYYSFSRFLLDFTRASEIYYSDPRLLLLITSQWVSLALFVLSFIMYFKLRQKNLFNIGKK